MEYYMVRDICNYYGCLCLAKDGEKYYWAIENYNGTHYKETTKRVYEEILAAGKNIVAEAGDEPHFD